MGGAGLEKLVEEATEGPPELLRGGDAVSGENLPGLPAAETDDFRGQAWDLDPDLRGGRELRQRIPPRPVFGFRDFLPDPLIGTFEPRLSTRFLCRDLISGESTAFDGAGLQVFTFQTHRGAWLRSRA